MANKKKELYRSGPVTEGKRNIIQGLMQEYSIESTNDIQEAGGKISLPPTDESFHLTVN